MPNPRMSALRFDVTQLFVVCLDIADQQRNLFTSRPSFGVATVRIHRIGLLQVGQMARYSRKHQDEEQEGNRQKGYDCAHLPHPSD